MNKKTKYYCILYTAIVFGVLYIGSSTYMIYSDVKQNIGPILDTCILIGINVILGCFLVFCFLHYTKTSLYKKVISFYVKVHLALCMISYLLLRWEMSMYDSFETPTWTYKMVYWCCIHFGQFLNVSCALIGAIVCCSILYIVGKVRERKRE